jgi:hypothetical protein
VSLRVVAALALGLAGAPAFGQTIAFPRIDPVPKPLLPVLLDRAPEPGDRWVYSTPVPSGSYRETVEVTAREAWGGGWRYRVETSAIAGAIETEWFVTPDGSVWLGAEWQNGALAVEPSKPTRVIRAGRKRNGLRRRTVWDPFAGSTIVWLPGTGSALRIRHRGRVHVGEKVPPAGDLWAGPTLGVRLATRSRAYCKDQIPPIASQLLPDRRREELLAWYDETLGLVAWQRTASEGCGWPALRVLLSAEVGGATYPPPTD